jgi:SAM-dependent methyltransferase
MVNAVIEQDRIAKVYDSDNLHSDGLVRAEILSSLLEPLEASYTHGSFLDLGCGYGGYSIHAARQGARASAVDISLHKIDVVTSRIAAEDDEVRSRLDCRYVDITTGLPFDSQSFDSAMSMGVIEWVALNQHHGDPRDIQLQVLTEVARVLKPGGTYILGTKNRWYPNYLLWEPQMKWLIINHLPRRMARAASMLAYNRDYRTYVHSQEGWEDLLREAGFKSIETYLPVYYYQFPLALMSTTGSNDLPSIEAEAADRLPMAYRQIASKGRASGARRTFLSTSMRLGIERHVWPAFIFLAKT